MECRFLAEPLFSHCSERRLKAAAVEAGSARARMVAARSAAEMPVGCGVGRWGWQGGEVEQGRSEGESGARDG
jgi:hypothetical protein